MVELLFIFKKTEYGGVFVTLEKFFFRTRPVTISPVFLGIYSTLTAERLYRQPVQQKQYKCARSQWAVNADKLVTLLCSLS